jgi:hypothetical protein
MANITARTVLTYNDLRWRSLCTLACNVRDATKVCSRVQSLKWFTGTSEYANRLNYGHIEFGADALVRHDYQFTGWLLTSRPNALMECETQLPASDSRWDRYPAPYAVG